MIVIKKAKSKNEFQIVFLNHLIIVHYNDSIQEIIVYSEL